MTDIVLAAHSAVMWTVQRALDTIEYHPQTCAMTGFYGGAQVVQQRLDLPPVNIAADGLMKNCA